ncbi:unnamed protein product [Paramecium sonneborni]|uniref:Uncharacterized protein n=1 Tax=Paramecium sonneborni TaxID=65129 RepID=A0A8S1MCG6_9CILI|nr:unnamed protein product [Paramecium sonneborni]
MFQQQDQNFCKIKGYQKKKQLTDLQKFKKRQMKVENNNFRQLLLRVQIGEGKRRIKHSFWVKIMSIYLRSMECKKEQKLAEEITNFVVYINGLNKRKNYFEQNQKYIRFMEDLKLAGIRFIMKQRSNLRQWSFETGIKLIAKARTQELINNQQACFIFLIGSELDVGELFQMRRRQKVFTIYLIKLMPIDRHQNRNDRDLKQIIKLIQFQKKYSNAIEQTANFGYRILKKNIQKS